MIGIIPNSIIQKISASVICFALLVAATISAAQPAPAPVESATTGPRIEFEKTVYDFQRAQSGEEISYDFPFKNTGDETLEIRNVKVTCGCTTSGDWTRLVEPGETGKIPLTLKTRGYKGKTTKTIRVYTNDKRRSMVNLKFTGNCWQAIQMTPRTASFGRVTDPDIEETRTVKITNNLPEPLQILGVACDSNAFDTEIRDVDPGKEYELVVTTTPPLKMGSNKAMVRITTSNPINPVVNVMAVCYVMPPIHVAPNPLYLRSGPMPQVHKKTVYVNNNRDKPLEISNVKVNIEGIEIETQETMEGKRYRITLTFPAGFEMEEDKKMLSFNTNDDQQQIIEIPILYFKPAKKG
jgi:hypothetical protein